MYRSGKAGREAGPALGIHSRTVERHAAPSRPRGRTDVDDDLIVRLRDDTPGDRPLPKWRTAPQGPLPARTASMTAAQPGNGTASQRTLTGSCGAQGKAGPVVGPLTTGRPAR